MAHELSVERLLEDLKKLTAENVRLLDAIHMTIVELEQEQLKLPASRSHALDSAIERLQSVLGRRIT